VRCGPVYEFCSVVLSGVVLSGYVRLHIWLHPKRGALALSRAILPVLDRRERTNHDQIIARYALAVLVPSLFA